MSTAYLDLCDGNPPLVASTESLEYLYRQMLWVQYEVDPEWSRFCEFGPEDIGSVWEDIGAIRRKRILDHIYVSEDVMDQIRKLAKDQDDTFTRPVESFHGIPVTTIPGSRLEGYATLRYIPCQSMKFLPKYILKGGTCD